MKMNDLYPSKYLKADDITHPVNVTVADVRMEEVGQQKDMRPVAYFLNAEKGLILNKTCFIEISAITGSDDTVHWSGKQIQLYRTITPFQGKPVPCIRIRPVPAPQPQAPQAAPQQTASAFKFDETIPDPGEPVRGGSNRPF